MSPLTQGLNYRSACYVVKTKPWIYRHADKTTNPFQDILEIILHFESVRNLLPKYPGRRASLIFQSSTYELTLLSSCKVQELHQFTFSMNYCCEALWVCYDL